MHWSHRSRRRCPVTEAESLDAHGAKEHPMRAATNDNRRPSMSAITRMLAAMFAATVLLAANEAAAQPWPAKPIKPFV